MWQHKELRQTKQADKQMNGFEATLKAELTYEDVKTIVLNKINRVMTISKIHELYTLHKDQVFLLFLEYAREANMSFGDFINREDKQKEITDKFSFELVMTRSVIYHMCSKFIAEDITDSLAGFEPKHIKSING